MSKAIDVAREVIMIRSFVKPLVPWHEGRLKLLESKLADLAIQLDLEVETILQIAQEEIDETTKEDFPL